MAANAVGSTAPAGQTRRIVAWTMYDWANSAFTTIVVTFVNEAEGMRAARESSAAG